MKHITIIQLQQALDIVCKYQYKSNQMTFPKCSGVHGMGMGGDVAPRSIRTLYEGWHPIQLLVLKDTYGGGAMGNSNKAVS